MPVFVAISVPVDMFVNAIFADQEVASAPLVTVIVIHKSSESASLSPKPNKLSATYPVFSKVFSDPVVSPNDKR